MGIKPSNAIGVTSICFSISCFSMIFSLFCATMSFPCMSTFSAMRVSLLGSPKIPGLLLKRADFGEDPEGLGWQSWIIITRVKMSYESISLKRMLTAGFFFVFGCYCCSAVDKTLCTASTASCHQPIHKKEIINSTPMRVTLENEYFIPFWRI